MWVHHRKKRFPSKRKSNLIARADGPLEVLNKINNNDLLGQYRVSYAFNVADLKLYYEDDLLENLTTNSFQQGEDDVPMKNHDDGQSQELPKSKEIQEVLKVMRNQLEDQVSYWPIISSVIDKILALVS